MRFLGCADATATTIQRVLVDGVEVPAPQPLSKEAVVQAATLGQQLLGNQLGWFSFSRTGVGTGFSMTAHGLQESQDGDCFAGVSLLDSGATWLNAYSCTPDEDQMDTALDLGRVTPEQLGEAADTIAGELGGFGSLERLFVESEGGALSLRGDSGQRQASVPLG